MDVIEALRRRRSIRAFKPDSVPQKTLREIMEVVIRSPSAMNTQPWQFTVATGRALAAIKERNCALLSSGTPLHPDFPPPVFQGVHRRRQVDIYTRLMELMKIPMEDKAKRARWMRHGFRFFEAPAVIVIYAPGDLDAARTQFDIGIVTQSICLAALGYGLGSCICLQAVSYPEMLREILAIGEDNKIAIAVALGYTEPDYPANKFLSPREAAADLVRWRD